METNLVVNGIYAHINNGGVSFGVTNESGPTINIQASHFGNLTNHIQLHVSKEGLKKLGEMFLAASKYEGYSPDYVCAADAIELDKDSGKVIVDESEATVQNTQASRIWTPKQ